MGNIVSSTKQGRLRRSYRWLSLGFVFAALLSFGPLQGQNLEQLGKAPSLQANGNLSLMQMYTHARGRALPRPPYSFMLQGQLNLRLMGIIDAPFSFLYSNLGSTLTQPTFNQQSLHPSYKWIQLHLGMVSMSWSPYTVAGHVFQGVGADFTPGSWKISALYGRFQKAVSPQDSVSGLVMPAFRRMGGGLQAVYSSGGGSFGACWFHARDDAGSLPMPFYITGITPQDNQVLGLQFGQRVWKKLKIQAEGAVSLLRSGLRSLEAPARHHAYKTSLIWSGRGGQITLQHERVDPGYRTLGAYYFNNDLENITAGTAVTMYKGRVNFQAQAGLQRDNLNGEKWSRMTRRVGSAQVDARLGKTGSLNLAYSNFLSYTNIRPYTDALLQNNPMLAWDTLNFRQVSQNVTANASCGLGQSGSTQNMLSATLLWQTSADRQGGRVEHGQVFYNAGINWICRHREKGWSTILGVNAGQNLMSGTGLPNVCPVFSLSAPVFHKKLQISGTLSSFVSLNGEEQQRSSVTGRLQISRQWKKVHRLSLSGFYQRATAQHLSIRREWSAILIFATALK